MLAMSIMGLSYNLRLVPKNFTRLTYRRIKDIPGSKTLLIAIAWGTVTAVLPPLSKFGNINWINILVALWASAMVFVRTSFFDILDMQGDRIVGKETIALLLGEKRSMRLLKIILLILIGTLIVSSTFHLTSSLGFALILCPVFIAIIILIYERALMFPGIRLEFLIETQFFLAGIISLIWVLTT